MVVSAEDEASQRIDKIADLFLDQVEAVGGQYHNESLNVGSECREALNKLVLETSTRLEEFNSFYDPAIAKTCLTDLFATLFARSELCSEYMQLLTLTAILSLSGLLTVNEVTSFGAHLDNYTDALERCSLNISIKLCSFFCDQESVLATILDQQKPATVRVARARLLGVVNAFEKKLGGDLSDAEKALARLRVVCFDRIPMNFQGVCNRGIRDAPGRHFSFPSTGTSYVEPVDVEDIELRTMDVPAGASCGEEGDVLSDSSSGSVKNYKHVGEKKRRTGDSTASNVTGGHFDIHKEPANGSPSTTISSSISLLSVFRQWERLMGFIQDPTTYLLSTTTGDALEVISGLITIVTLASQMHCDDSRLSPASKTAPSESPLPRIVYCAPKYPSREVNEETTSYRDRETASCLTETEQSFALETNGNTVGRESSNNPSPSQSSGAVLRTHGNTEAGASSENIAAYVLSYNVKYSFVGFKEVWASEMFRRDMLMRIAAMLRVFHVKRQQCGPTTSSSSAPSTPPEGPVPLFDLLAPSLKTAIMQLHDRLYQSIQYISSCLPEVPPVCAAQLPWFTVPPIWRPPQYLSTLVDELDNQESIMTHWKKEGCADKKPPDWVQPVTLEVTEVDKEPGFVPQELLQHPPAQSSGVRISRKQPAHGTAPYGDPKLQRRQNVYINQFLPVLRLLDPVASPQPTASDTSDNSDASGVTVIGHTQLQPPTFSRERVEWFLPEPTVPPVPLRSATIAEKLRQKWGDYKEKVISDEDPVNEIEESEKVLKDSLFQWRCDRLLNFTNLQLYDYNNQNRELRVKIREASLEDLIRAAMQREASKANQPANILSVKNAA